MLSPQKIVDNADAVAAVLDVIADITDMRAVRTAEVVVAGVRAALDLLAGIGDGTLDGTDVDKRVDALRDDLKATDAKHDGAMTARFCDCTPAGDAARGRPVAQHQEHCAVRRPVANKFDHGGETD